MYQGKNTNKHNLLKQCYFGRLARRPNTKITHFGSPAELFFYSLLYYGVEHTIALAVLSRTSFTLDFYGLPSKVGNIALAVLCVMTFTLSSRRKV